MKLEIFYAVITSRRLLLVLDNLKKARILPAFNDAATCFNCYN